MGNRFVNRWREKEKQPSLASKIKNVGKPSENLKGQINFVIQRLDTQTNSLDSAVKRFQIRDAEIFNRVVTTMAEHDEARANILATELSEIRKVEKMLTHASLALQSVSMRLNTVSEMGDLLTVLAPAKNVLNSIRSEMCGVLPEASQELGNIGNLLGDIVVSTNQGSDVPVNVGKASTEAEEILREASLAAEMKLSQQLPDVAFEKLSKERESIET